MMFLYVDDMKIVCITEFKLNNVLTLVNEFWAAIGLHCDPIKCKAMVIGDAATEIHL